MKNPGQPYSRKVSQKTWGVDGSRNYWSNKTKKQQMKMGDGHDGFQVLRGHHSPSNGKYLLE